MIEVHLHRASGKLVTFDSQTFKLECFIEDSEYLFEMFVTVGMTMPPDPFIFEYLGDL